MVGTSSWSGQALVLRRSRQGWRNLGFTPCWCRTALLRSCRVHLTDLWPSCPLGAEQLCTLWDMDGRSQMELTASFSRVASVDLFRKVCLTNPTLATYWCLIVIPVFVCVMCLVCPCVIARNLHQLALLAGPRSGRYVW
jgi:hypothetical protein